MDIPTEKILDCVREPLNPVAAFARLRQIGQESATSFLWDGVPTPDVSGDVELTRQWLAQEIVPFRPTGVYLGLDTLNERSGEGSNVELGMTRAADPKKTQMDWAWRCERYGAKHLIRGLYDVHRSYGALKLSYHEGLLADYVLFLGYSGIVRISALQKLPATWDCLFVWGFHDGDIAFLARSSPSAIERLATFEGT